MEDSDEVVRLRLQVAELMGVISAAASGHLPLEKAEEEAQRILKSQLTPEQKKTIDDINTMWHSFAKHFMVEPPGS